MSESSTSSVLIFSLKSLCIAVICIILCLPFNRTVAQEIKANLVFDGELWTLQELYVLRSDIPPPTNEYEVFRISKNGLIWTIGGSLKNPNTELIYVDRKNRTIGPFTSSIDVSGERYTCLDKKNATENLRKNSSYNACRSEFYGPDLIIKGVQVLINCALTLCTGGGLTHWWPIFKAKRLHNALMTSQLMGQFSDYYQNKEREFIDRDIENFIKLSNQVLDSLDRIDKQPQDAISLSDNVNALKRLSSSLNARWEQLSAQHHSGRNSLAFALSDHNVLIKLRPATVRLISTNQKIETLQDQLNRKLTVVLSAERLVIKDIQGILKTQGYYTFPIDGLFGAGTVGALNDVSKDVNVLVNHTDKKILLETVKGAFIPSTGACSRSKNDRTYMACFSLNP
jgi:hypothetical protein